MPGGGVAWRAHIGGFVAGVAVAIVASASGGRPRRPRAAWEA